MFDILLVVVVLLFVVMVVFGFFIFGRSHNNSAANILLQKQMSDLIKTNQELKEGITETINKKLAHGNTIVTDSINTQFDKSFKIIESVTKQVAEVKDKAGHIASIGEQINKLQSILQNPKQRGILGEYFLKTTIQQVLPDGVYKFQYHFKDRLIADAVIFLDDKLLAIDAKFSLENYTNYLEANDKQKGEQFLKQFRADLKLRINETAKYIKPDENTFDFAFMFIPSESIYYDLLTKNIEKDASRSLIEYAFIEKRVIIVSPTTLYAYLQTVLQGLRSLTIDNQADEIRKNINKLHKHLQTYKEDHTALGKSLMASMNHYEKSDKHFDLIDKDIVKMNTNNKPKEIKE